MKKTGGNMGQPCKLGTFSSLKLYWI